MQEEEALPLVLTKTNAAKYLGVSRTIFYKEVVKHLATVPIGDTEYVSRESLDQFYSERLKRPANQ